MTIRPKYARYARGARSLFSYHSLGHHNHSAHGKRLKNPLSYRIVDDDDENGINPCVRETLLIAARRLSAVTLTPGCVHTDWMEHDVVQNST